MELPVDRFDKLPNAELFVVVAVVLIVVIVAAAVYADRRRG